jgi:hypothetical protein
VQFDPEVVSAFSQLDHAALLAPIAPNGHGNGNGNGALETTTLRR